MIARIKIDGSYVETIDEKGKCIKRARMNNDFLGHSSKIAVFRDGSYIEVYDEDLKNISRIRHSNIDGFICASAHTYSIQDGSYVETFDEKGKQISRTRS